MRATVWALAALLTLAPVAWAKGVSLRHRVKGVSLRQRVSTAGLPEYEETAFFADDKAGRDGEHLRVIVDLHGKTVTLANKDDKTVSITPLDVLPRKADSVTLKPTGKTEKIAGHEAREYTIEGGGLSGSVWLAGGFNVPGDTRMWGLRAGLLSPKVPAGTLTEAIVTAKGIPMRSSVSLTVGSQKMDVHTEVVSVTDGVVPADIASVPAGFTPVDAKNMAQKK
jgi:hypothetical protein